MDHLKSIRLKVPDGSRVGRAKASNVGRRSLKSRVFLAVNAGTESQDKLISFLLGVRIR